jgi:pimeloyl-ACP methyl ester carboxylesterase
VDTCPTGYQLAGGVVVDAQRLTQLLAAASDMLAGEPRRAMALAEEAASLRRGRPLVDLEDRYAFVTPAAARLEDHWIRAQELLAECRLRLGEAALAADGLAQVLEEHPYRERLWALLMRALYLDGRASDALAAFQRVRRVLADDLGLDPSPILVDAEQAVLNHAVVSEADVVPAWAPARPGFHELSYVRDHAVQLVWRRTGQGPPVVLVSGSASFLVPLAERWLGHLSRDLSVVAFDPRGIGRSDPIIGPCTLDDRVADLAAVIRAAGIEKAVLVAVNDGGPIALAAAAKLPDVVAGIVMFNTWDAEPFSPDSEDFERNQRYYEATWGTGCTLWALDPALAERPEVRRAVIEAEILIASPSQALAVNLAAAGSDGRPFIPAIGCPVTVLHTEGNRVLPVEGARQMAERLRAPLVALPGSNHNFLFDDPEASVGPIRAFTTSVVEGSEGRG